MRQQNKKKIEPLMDNMTSYLSRAVENYSAENLKTQRPICRLNFEGAILLQFNQYI